MALSYRDNRQEVGWAILVAVGGAFAYFTLWIVLVPLLASSYAEVNYEGAKIIQVRKWKVMLLSNE